MGRDKNIMGRFHTRNNPIDGKLSLNDINNFFSSVAVSVETGSGHLGHVLSPSSGSDLLQKLSWIRSHETRN